MRHPEMAQHDSIGSSADGAADWHACVIARSRLGDLPGEHWVRRLRNGWRLEVTGQGAVDWHALAVRFLGPVSGEPDLLTHDDPAAGIFRAAAFDGDGLALAILVDRGPLAIDRAWLEARLATPLDAAERFRLLDGRPGGSLRPRGPIVCFCRDVGREEIVDAARAGAISPEAIGAATTAGTNCGRCRDELVEVEVAAAALGQAAIANPAAGKA